MKREANSPRRLRTLGWSGTLESCSGGAACVTRGGLLRGMCVMPGKPGQRPQSSEDRVHVPRVRPSRASGRAHVLPWAHGVRAVPGWPA